ncbi:TIR domain-containing protein [Candidatus Magnetobacterium casense]|uniref:TIR domain-containing protein n=1 Tax=Candidatus Magnetobacterium casense TaxID=1455061 RepID=A0ABS6RZX5_9BACT|nr:TIR domain-containing protein [Candidatus Magnetobacterium casensis]MBV6342111.1 TIR domain-containing protein [Candidatus Magnetobacterium casensis]
MAGIYGNQEMIGMMTAMKTKRPHIFVSYHHDNDQPYYDEFSRYFHEQYETVRDNSLDRRINSDYAEYVNRMIREDYITGTSCTIVLIGSNSHERKYIDWEIKSTLDKEHGLVGIILPTHVKNPSGEIIVPERFYDNHKRGYAVLEYWNKLTAPLLTQLIATATGKPKSLIDNLRPMRQRNG